MKDRYIKQVKQALKLPREKKGEIVRDLQEAFASAAEHSETDEQVIARLGTPKDFAASIHEQLGIGGEAKKRRRLFQIGGTLVAALAAFSMCAAIHVSRTLPHIIGQADAMTSMQVSGAGLDPADLFLALGMIAALISVMLTIQYIRNRSTETGRRNG